MATRIYNGAKDNAVGTAGLLEIARAFTKPAGAAQAVHPVSGGHGRGAGTARFASTTRCRRIYPLAKTVAIINMDGLNVHGRTRI